MSLPLQQFKLRRARVAAVRSEEHLEFSRLRSHGNVGAQELEFVLLINCFSCALIDLTLSGYPQTLPPACLFAYQVHKSIDFTVYYRIGAGGGTRTRTTCYSPRILSPVRLPFRHTGRRMFAMALRPIMALNPGRLAWEPKPCLATFPKRRITRLPVTGKPRL